MKKYRLDEVLKSIGEGQRTGTLLCVGEDSDLGYVYFVQGVPRAARYRNHLGKSALMEISQHLLVSLKFHNDVNLVKSPSAIGTLRDSAINDGIRLTGGEVTASEFKSALDVAALTNSEGEGSQLDIPLSRETRDILANELTEFIGPVAHMVVHDLKQTISLKDALGALAHEIGDMDSAIQFVEKIKKTI